MKNEYPAAEKSDQVQGCVSGANTYCVDTTQIRAERRVYSVSDSVAMTAKDVLIIMMMEEEGYSIVEIFLAMFGIERPGKKLQFTRD